MGAVASGATEEQTTCNYNEKQHDECKKTVANYEQMIADYNTLIDKAEKDKEALDFKIAELENELNHSNTISKESEEKLKKLEKKLKEYENINKKVKELETKLTTTETNYKNTQKKLTDTESKYKSTETNYNKLNDRINRLKKVCTAGDTSKCKVTDVYKILQEKFTPMESSCGTIMYCIIALVVGILIGAWLFGNNNRSASTSSTGGNIFNPQSINKNDSRFSSIL